MLDKWFPLSCAPNEKASSEAAWGKSASADGHRGALHWRAVGRLGDHTNTSNTNNTNNTNTTNNTITTTNKNTTNTNNTNNTTNHISP